MDHILPVGEFGRGNSGGKTAAGRGAGSTVPQAWAVTVPAVYGGAGLRIQGVMLKKMGAVLTDRGVHIIIPCVANVVSLYIILSL